MYLAPVMYSFLIMFEERSYSEEVFCRDVFSMDEPYRDSTSNGTRVSWVWDPWFTYYSDEYCCIYSIVSTTGAQ